MASFLLVHSPLVGPMTWHAVARELRARGHATAVPDVRAAAGDDECIARLATATADSTTAAGEHHDLVAPVLVVHSGAGVAVPSIAAALGEQGRSPERCLFVDAQLPRPGLPADDAFLVFLRARVGADGRLAPFPQWWSDEVMATLVPSAAMREQFEAECQPVPIASYERPAPVVEGWPGPPCGYLRLSDGYADVAAAAAELGWPVRCLAADHLAPLTRAGAVTDELLALLR